MVQEIEMTKEEQMTMYMKCSKKELCEMLIEANRHLKNLPIHVVSNWVACKDALPKQETDVICYCLDFEVRVGRKTGDYWFIDGYSLPQDITHWKELPKPPCY